jgi:hypothetical protein
MEREVFVWHDALDRPREGKVLSVIDWWESVGWELVERHEKSRSWFSRDWTGKTVLKFQKRHSAGMEPKP